MAKVTMLNMAGEAVGDIELKDEIFESKSTNSQCMK